MKIVTLKHFVAAIAATGAFVYSPSPGQWFETFDFYNTTQPLPQQSSWIPWNNDPNAANFFATTAQSFNPPNSVEIDALDDAVHLFNHTTGVWTFFTMAYVPSAMTGQSYFILLNTYPATTANSEYWSLQLEFDGANGVVNDFNGTASAPLVLDSWATIMVIIDLPNDTQTVYYNGNLFTTKSWTGGVAPGGAMRIAAVDLFANGNTPVYYDDMSLIPSGRPSFSIDFQSASISAPDSWMFVPITEADILVPPPPMWIPMPGFLPPPATAVYGGPGAPGPDLGLPGWAGVVGHPPGVPGFIEVDAHSWGNDYNLDDGGLPIPPLWAFSVDEFAGGIPGAGPGPDVWTEGSTMNQEAAADIFADLVIGPGPFPPGPVVPDLAIFDGNGVPPHGGTGYGLLEPIPPLPGVIPEVGDNIDSLDIDQPAGHNYVQYPIYFSLDSAFPDPLEPWPPVNSGSAATIGFVGGDVLMCLGPGAFPVVYATANQLGLDTIGGPDSDDLDALILWDNGDGIYQPSQQPFDWIGGATDMLLFSVRRQSAVITFPDSLWGAPIEECDILCPPVVGGASPWPGIFIPGEMLGLISSRVGVPPPFNFPDDLNALDLCVDCDVNRYPDWYDLMIGLYQDCNANGIPDFCDIQYGTSLDCNNNGIPDECESPAPCPWDLTGDCIVDINDIFVLLGIWGPCPPPCPPYCTGDFNQDCTVDINDIFIILGQWGACP